MVNTGSTPRWKTTGYIQDTSSVFWLDILSINHRVNRTLEASGVAWESGLGIIAKVGVEGSNPFARSKSLDSSKHLKYNGINH